MSTSTETHSKAVTVTPASRPGTPTWEIAYLYPTQGEWTEEDYLALDTNHLVEFTDGCLEFLPMPNLLHQFLVDYLHSLLKSHVQRHESGRVLFAPLPVRLRPGTIREPDVVWLKPERMTDLRQPPDGADLVMEVVSEGESARQRDIQTKRHEYAQAGIPEYWIIDPESSTATVLTLHENEYREHGTFGTGTTADSVLLPGFTVNIDELFAAARTSETPPETPPTTES